MNRQQRRAQAKTQQSASKTKYHLAHIIPNPQMHGLNGYKEVIETLQWGLGQLGHESTYAVNQVSADATNIVFGAQMMPLSTLRSLPSDTILYQLEQLRDPTSIKPDYSYALQNFRVWDYSAFNLDVIRQLNPAHEVKLVPVGYAPILERIAKPEMQDIDVLMYGIAGQERLSAVHALSRSGLVTVFVSGLYGAARDALIARAKLVVNVTLYSKVFEIVRVSYLLANRKAVVAVLDSNISVESGIEKGIKISSQQTLVADCLALLRDDASRRALEEGGYAIFRERDICNIVSEALAA